MSEFFSGENNFNISHGGVFNATQNVFVTPPKDPEDPTRRALAMLPATDMRELHQDNLDKRVGDTCDWFLQDYFSPWVDGTDPKYWIRGRPGTGKTTIGALIIDDLERRVKETEGMSACYFYCRHVKKNATIEDVLLTFVRQHVERDLDASFATLVESAMARHKREQTRPRQPELEQLLKAVVQRRKTFYVLDALDEFPAKLRIAIIKSLSSLGARLVITSRIRKQLEDKFREGTTFFEARARDVDIDRLLDNHISQSLELAAVIDQPERREEVGTTIKRNCDGMFLHAALQIAALHTCTTYADVLKVLEEFPHEIKDYYTDILKRIFDQPEAHSDIARLGFIYLLTAYAPLKIEDLQCALAFDPTAPVPFDSRRVLPVDTLLSLFCGLVIVDEKTQCARFIHTTAAEFLAKQMSKDPLFGRRHDIIASMTIARLEDQNFPRSSINSLDAYNHAIVETPMLWYAYAWWAEHVHQSCEPTTRQRALQFIASCESYPLLWSRGVLDHLSSVHMAAMFGFLDALSIVDEDALCTPTRSIQRTPLILASLMGHVEVVQKILQASVDVNQQDDTGLSALMVASLEGNIDVVRLLLGAPEIAVNHAADNGVSSLMLASQNGHVDVVRLLLDAPEIAVNHAANNGFSSLMLASQNGHVDVVRPLLDTPEIAVNHAANNGFSSLLLASQNGHVDVVRPLLDTPEIAVNHAANNGFSSLLLASQNGHVDVVRLLLDAPEIAVNHAADDGSSSLMLASQNGHVDVVRLLLDAPEIAVNHAANNGSSSLMLASQNDHVDVVRLLLDAPEIAVNHAANNGSSSLMLASQNGHVDVVRLLLDAPEIAVNHAANNGSSSLMLASHNGHVDVVRLLLDAPEIAVNHAANNGFSSLMLASQNGYVNIVRLLLDAPEIAVNHAANNGSSSLMLASLNGHVDVIRLLLDAPEIAVNQAADNGASSLIMASHNGHVDVVRLLLDAAEIAVNHVTNAGTSSLMFASQNGHVDIVRLLSGASGTNDMPSANPSAPALIVAAEHGHTQVVRRLPSHPQNDVNLQEHTTLTSTVEHPREDVVQTLGAHVQGDAETNRAEEPRLRFRDRLRNLARAARRPFASHD